MAARVSLRARRHRMLGFGGGGIDGGVSADCVLRKRCCSAGSCCSRRAPTAGSGVVPRRPRPRRRAALSDKGEQSSNRCSPTRAVAYVCWGVSRAFGQPFRAALFAQTASRTDQTKSGRSFRLAY